MVGERNFVVKLGEREVGTAKTHFDASFHVNMLNEALDNAYRDGYNKGLEDGKKGS
jgi:uncharacterized protein (DUF2164 family)